MYRHRTTATEGHVPRGRTWTKSLVTATLLASSVALVATERPVAAQNDGHVESMLGSAGTTVWREAIQSAIDPDDYECEPSGIGTWIDELLSQSDPASLDVLFGTGAVDWPIVYKLFFDNDDTDEFIGADGSYTREHLKRQRDLLRFWDVPLDDVGLYGMHGSIIRDDAKMLPVLQQFIFPGIPEADAQIIIDLVQDVIESDPTIGYDWPLFSFNAVAFGPDPLKVLMGDGLIAFFEDIGLADNGVDLVYAHEVAHQVQGVLGVFVHRCRRRLVAPSSWLTHSRRTTSCTPAAPRTTNIGRSTPSSCRSSPATAPSIRPAITARRTNVNGPLSGAPRWLRNDPGARSGPRSTWSTRSTRSCRSSWLQTLPDPARRVCTGARSGADTSAACAPNTRADVEFNCRSPGRRAAYSVESTSRSAPV